MLRSVISGCAEVASLGAFLAMIACVAKAAGA
jgi:hypothetical protein